MHGSAHARSACRARPGLRIMCMHHAVMAARSAACSIHPPTCCACWIAAMHGCTRMVGIAVQLYVWLLVGGAGGHWLNMHAIWHGGDDDDDDERQRQRGSGCGCGRAHQYPTWLTMAPHKPRLLVAKHCILCMRLMRINVHLIRAWRLLMFECTVGVTRCTRACCGPLSYVLEP